MKRVLVPKAAPGAVRLEGPRFHHLSVVQRVAVGDAVEVFDGEGQVFDATVEALDGAAVTLRLSGARRVLAPRRVVVVQGLPKAEKLELVLQKGTELGASAFLPAQARRSVARLDGKEAQKLARFRRIVEEAARQCGRADVPEVLTPCALEAADVTGAAMLVLDEAEKAVPLSMALDALPADAPLALVVGPEGGLDRAEVQALVSRGARTVTLGPRILRTETAALAALAVIRHRDGQLG
ncbi:MAG: 16S rRNA (uracil(1498)-N(3))-methyltransferase [Myxococcaceae bacterium]|jgi:16S rRNA (uracil1498-N3)-methyltransferase|nr:16S rRNA (uracil(1498)-N(3))-methyltransferase [Myxococcaceae bacterium]MCA3012751.1 16S rRNA (uracil(1498)-N(3))-methyltransferase [Myxococcaceae bacterium]